VITASRLEIKNDNIGYFDIGIWNNNWIHVHKRLITGKTKNTDVDQRPSMLMIVRVSRRVRSLCDNLVKLRRQLSSAHQPPRHDMYDPPPERPSESDCCGNGCAECVFDVYDREYARWRHRRRTGQGDRLRRDLLSATKCMPYRIVSARPLGDDDVHAYTFAATPAASGRLPIAYTQHVHVRLADGLDRPYTPVAVADDGCSFDVLVKAYPGGRFTGRLLEMSVDDVVAVRGPYGGVRYDGYDSVVMFAGGTGVAAFVGLIGSALDDDKCETLLRLHYSCKTLDGVLMRKELADYAAYWNCAVHLYLTREHDWAQRSKSFWYNENITKGRISQDCVAKIVDKQQNLKTLWLICGNDEFNRYVFNSLVDYNIKRDDIRLLNNTTKDFEVS